MTGPLFSLATATAVMACVACADARAGLTLQLNDGSRIPVDEVVAVEEAALTVGAVGERIRIERTIPWSRIVGAQLDDERFSTAELRLTFGLVPSEEELVSHVSGTAEAIVRGLPATVGGSPCPCAVVPPLFAAPAPCSPCHAPCSLQSVPFVLLPCSPPIDPFRPVGRVIGVRPDPIGAYGDLAPSVYPRGIPTTEAAFALGLLRERRRLEAISPFVTPYGPPAPPVSAPPVPPRPTGDVVPGELSQIEARVVPLRLGGGADVSALGVTLFGFDAAGGPVPIEGTGQFFLYGGRQRLVRAFDDVYAAEPEGLIRLGEWTRAVAPDASLVLRLAEPLPDHDPNVTPIGSLRVRLSVPGRGVFEAVSEPVTLRPASPLRGAVRRETGSRFLPDEKTTASPVQAWPHNERRSSID